MSKTRTPRRPSVNAVRAEGVKDARTQARLAAFGRGLVPQVPGAAGAGALAQRLVGFWAVWHVYGSTAAMIESGHWPSSGVYRQLLEFRQVYGVDVSEFFPVQAVCLTRRTDDLVAAGVQELPRFVAAPEPSEEPG